ncbi:DUF7577 domain-containing protein [Halorubrum sp. DTA98]|uniref:DUF7577 domain-containing protein n=1 Tax=Halorubrum sp. DTA98 TaxID=3402163 RepID=UPI003AAEB4BC
MSVELLAAAVAGVIAINLIAAWLMLRADHDPSEFFDGGTWRPIGKSDDGNGSDEDDVSGEGNDVERDDTGRNAVDDTPEWLDIDPDGSNAGPDGDPPPPLSSDCDAVVCRHCGAENRPGYRYCRWCVRSGFVDGTRANAGDPATTQRPF